MCKTEFRNESEGEDKDLKGNVGKLDNELKGDKNKSDVQKRPSIMASKINVNYDIDNSNSNSDNFDIDVPKENNIPIQNPNPINSSIIKPAFDANNRKPLDNISTNESDMLITDIKSNAESTVINELNTSIIKSNNELNKTFNTCNPYLKGNGLKSDVISN